MLLMNLILLILSVIITSIIPFFLPITIWLITNAIHAWIFIHVLVLCICVGCAIMWLCRYYADGKMMSYLQHKKTPKIHSNIRKMTIGKIEWVLHKSHNVYMIWLCTATASWSSIPDMLIIRLVRSKLNIYQRLSAYITWKLLLYIPIIYWVQIALSMMKMM